MRLSAGPLSNEDSELGKRDKRGWQGERKNLCTISVEVIGHRESILDRSVGGQSCDGS